ncbi:hypothetical protein HAHI6034_03260 [Hathewaya histolytica]|uniref:Uncharacterized protein n=1 Tax=Hathewaya histolytica TaxID=1498 RepID=A0A4U9R4G8_HATHI|nr:Uncharacterised protein [Hathewaya histolytica]
MKEECIKKTKDVTEKFKKEVNIGIKHIEKENLDEEL